MNPIDSVWTEKHRPEKIAEVVGDFRDKVEKYLDKPDSIPHFLLYSKAPGTGKTSLAKAIIKQLDCDALYLNSSDDRKIDTIREKVKEFAMTMSSKVGKRRIVFMDEFDGMLKASQEALKNIMETYQKNVIFILTANNIHKVIEPIQSRCQKICLASPNKNEIAQYLEYICKEEGMTCTPDGLKHLVDIQV